MIDGELCDRVSEVKPDIVLLTSMFTTEYPAVNRISSLIKRKFNLPIIIGGHHAELRPLWHLDEGEASTVAFGEGELNVNKIINAVFGVSPLSEVDGIAYRDASGKLKANSKKEHLRGLDGRWNIREVILRNGRHRYPLNLVTRNPRLYLPKSITSKGAGVLYASRGCPYNCEYCNTTDRDGEKIRHMSLERMVEITREFMHLGSNVFHNESDTFGIHPIDRNYLEWVAEQRRSGQRISLVNTNSFFARFFFPHGNFSPERVDLLKNAGFETLTISIESFNPKFNRGKLKEISLEMLNECFAYIKQQGLNIDLYMMYLFPRQTEDELRKDIQSVEKLAHHLTTITWRSLAYFPGTEYYNWAIKERKFSEEGYRQMIHQGHSFYHLDPRFNFSEIRNPTNLMEYN
jgi:radical SAM superfamily enzyme YgiQ (UPF0313 family)